jgi:signal transduction histidine kinase/CheY-like chemotaxis protein
MLSDRAAGRLHDGDSIEDLTRTTLTALCVTGLAAGWLWLFVSASLAPDAARQLAQLRTLVPPVTLLAVCAACLVRNRLTLAGRSSLFLVGLACTFLLSFLWLSSTAWLYFLSLVVIVAGLLVGSAAAPGAALVLTLACLALGGRSPSPGITPLLPALGLLWATALTSWLSSRSLYTALRWAMHSQKQAVALLDELRQRQGELNRTLAALTEASRRLERTNQELAVARERAEEARAMKEHFVANVSHELRTPLNLIVGFSEMMYLEPESYDNVGWTADLQSDIGELYRASRHLQSLVNDILDLSRIDAARLPMFREMADVREVIKEAVETISPLLRQRRLACALEWPESVSPVLLDQTRIRQVLLNLLNNAVRFTDAGGITVRLGQTDRAVVVSVHDTGAGIPPDKLESIFEKFQQVDEGPRRRGGAGLGLALSRQLVELHGGRMWAESQLGVGSTFHFSLPLPGSVPQTSPLFRTPGPKRSDASEGPVIVVDPDPTIADMLSRYLSERTVVPAKDTREAQAMIEAEHPLAVVVNQPPGAPAEAWVGPLGEASERYSVPVFRCSIPSPSWLKQSRGLDDCLTKPVSREALRAAFARHGADSGPVLVVDDSPGFASLMVRMLTTTGLARQVLTAYTGAEGLRLAREMRPNLVLLDLLLPDMHGFAVLSELRQDPALADTRVVAVTATSYAEEALLRQGSQLTLSQSAHLSTGTLTRLLDAALRIVRPHYVEEDSTSASA